MKTLHKFNRKAVSLLLCLAVLVSFCAGFIVISEAAEQTVTVITGSDYQPSSSTQPYNYCAGVMAGLKNAGVDPYGVLMCGDYSGGFGTTATEEGIADIKSLIQSNFGTVNQQIYVQGNHDPAASAGLTSSGPHDTEYYGVYVLNDDDYGWYNGDATSMDGMDGHLSTIKASAESMRSYFAQKASEGYDKPIFVAAHIPLHNSYRTRTYEDGQYAMYIVDALNEAGAAGLNVIYLYGHNHSSPSDDYIGGGSVFKTRGDTLFVSQIGDVSSTPVQVPLNFTYMNAGYVGYCANGNPGGNILNMAIFEITGNNVIVKRCSADGFVNVGAQCSWWSNVESAAVYGTTDAYLSPATGKTETLTTNYNGWNMVNTYKYSTEYTLVSALSTGGTYVIADSNVNGSALAVKYAVGDVGTASVTVTETVDGTRVSGVTTDLEWKWTLLDGYYGVFQGSGGRYLQIIGQSGGHLRTSSDYVQTEDGTRYSMWRMSSVPSNGMYAYVYDSTYSGTDTRSYLRSTGTSMVSALYNDLGSTTTKPVYVYQKANVPTTTTYWAKVEGVTDYSENPLYFSSWENIEEVIHSKLVVTVKDSTGTYTTNNFTLGTINSSLKGYSMIPVYYKGQEVGAVTVYIDEDASLSRLKSLIFESNYYSDSYADLKSAFGTDEEKLWNHFLSYGIKEGRKTSPLFDIKYYLNNNASIKAAYGNDYFAALDYYANFGYKEECYTSQTTDLGDNFYAKIGTSLTDQTNLSFSDTGVAMFTGISLPEQVWNFIKQEDGTYVIINQKSGLALSVENNGNTSNTNVLLKENIHESGQRWAIIAIDDYYMFRPMCSTQCVLDIYAAKTTSGADVNIYKANYTNAQKFTIASGNYFEMVEPEDIGTDFVGSFNKAKAQTNINTTGTNAEMDIYDTDNTSQKFYFIRQADGTYKIVSAKSKYTLGTMSNEASANVVVHVEDGTLTIDKWLIYCDKGEYIFLAANTSNLVLSVKDNNFNEASNVILDEFTGSEGQSFALIDIGEADYEIKETASSGNLSDAQIESVRDILYTVDSNLNGQDIDSEISEYAQIAHELGVDNIQGIMMCVNIGFIGGESEMSRILGKCGDVYTLDTIYAAMLTDVGNQAGAYRIRNLNAYCMIEAI